VHNPLGAYLSASQQSLEWGYKKRLQEEFGLVFNQLFTLNNIPIGRYLQFLLQSGNYEEYMLELKMAFNPGALDGVMCRNTISVGWDGKLYDCDFNQMLDLPINQRAGSHIRNFNINDLREREIVTENHCFGCVAGQGSSCQGSII
jgi:radical SAM/Cys-rich protein